MAYIISSTVKLSEINTDAFGHLTTTSPAKMFEYTGENSTVTTKYATVVAGTGSVSSSDNFKTYDLSTGGTATGAKCTRESTRFMRYISGQAMLIAMTGVLGASKTNVISRIGYFDDNDGLFFAQTATGPAVVVRNSISGSLVDPGT